MIVSYVVVCGDGDGNDADGGLAAVVGSQGSVVK